MVLWKVYFILFFKKLKLFGLYHGAMMFQKETNQNVLGLLLHFSRVTFDGSLHIKPENRSLAPQVLSFIMS